MPLLKGKLGSCYASQAKCPFNGCYIIYAPQQSSESVFMQYTSGTQPYS